MPRIIRDDGARLEYQIAEPVNKNLDALPFIFQHGMGGDRNQPLGYIGQLPSARLICMDARGHGDSTDILASDRCSFDAFADDVIALADQLGIARFVVGGISLGAGTALNVALRYPERVAGLVLCRPAWLEHAQAEKNAGAYSLIADLLDQLETDQALKELIDSGIYREVIADSKAAAQSLRHQVTRPRAAVNAEILRTFPTSAPSFSKEKWAGIEAPTLVVGHQHDPFHPWRIAQSYAENISGADLVEVPSKDRDAQAFAHEVNSAITEFVETFSGPAKRP
ncbi:alpha/beta hydrolase [Glutamicibacter halophytocola]|uniref:alpha/beta fold hydrolase n=1 Tax=Glutamicibacter halophytocola TaxID=1933880 RepID=UPI00321AAA0E